MKRVAHSSIALLIAYFLFACGPTAPTERDARAWFEADQQQIQAFDDGVRAHIEAEGLLVTVTDEEPNALERRTSVRRSRATFREVGLPDYTRQAGALRSEIRLLDGEDDTGTLANAGSSAPVRESGVTPAEDGATLSGRQLGWGVYGIENSEGVLEKKRAYEVRWEVEMQGRRLGFRLFMDAH
ncbi:MAG: hypothetical protein JRH11_21665 [Deltaproteobacteria bacterium]|nr:hypothetical protein [Deltaproteobacteria bacterium]